MAHYRGESVAMLRWLTFVALLWAGTSLGAQQPMQAITGVVRDPNELPLAGADIVLGQHRVMTSTTGAFRIDSVPVGKHALTVRLIGFAPVHTIVAVVAIEPTDLDLYLTPMAVRLPATIVEGNRTGIFGTVGDTAYRIADGARVQLLGPKHLEVLTDSLGKFAFPGVPRGSYIVRVTYQNYTERRILVELQEGVGRELAVLLAPSTERTHMADETAARDLGLRLAISVKRERLTSSDMARIGAGSVCDLPQLKTEIGNSMTTVVLNGRTVYLEMPVEGLCAWRADEVELVEFGNNVCKEQTHTIADVMKIYCGPLGARGPTSIIPNGSNRLPGAQSYVVIWEKK